MPNRRISRLAEFLFLEWVRRFCSFSRPPVPAALLAIHACYAAIIASASLFAAAQMPVPRPLTAEEAKEVLAGATRSPKGSYGMDLNESYPSQIAYWRTHDQGLGVCASTCITSHMETNVHVRSLAPGQSVPYSVVYRDFTRYQRNHNPADMILVLRFFHD